MKYNVATVKNSGWHRVGDELWRETSRQKQTRRAKMQRIAIASIVSILLISGVMCMLGVTTYIESLQTKINKLETKTMELTADNTVLKQTVTEYETTLDEQTMQIEQLSTGIEESKMTVTGLTDIIDELDAQIVQLKEDNLSLASEYDKVSAAYDTLKERKELYDKYKYAIMYSGERTELTYDQIKLGEELMKEEGLNPHILFSIGMTESKYTSDAKNSCSTATGYHQFLAGTGKFVYEDLLGYGDGTYVHSRMATNGTTNIKMAVAYLAYLKSQYKGNLYSMMMNYSGRDLSGAKSYMNVMNSYTKQVGVNIFSIANNSQ